MVETHCAGWRELDPATAYAVLRLRVDVFVVEQQCPYPELDGRDVEPEAVHVWATHGAEVVGCLRILHDDGVRRIGRVCVRSDHRGQGVAALLVDTALGLCPGDEVVLDAQSYLRGWYARFGFDVAGPEFDEDGIAHVPMRRSAGWPKG